MSTVTGLIEFLKPMLYDESSNGESADPETIQNEQTYLARIVHLVLNDDPNENFTMLEAFKEELLQGGNARIVHTVPSLVYAYLKLSRYVHQCYQHAQSEAEQQEAEGDLPTNSETKVFNRKPKFFKGEIKISHKDLFLTARNLIQRIIFLNAPICLRLNLSLVLAINEVSIEKEVYFNNLTHHINLTALISMTSLLMRFAQMLYKSTKMTLLTQTQRFEVVIVFSNL